MSALHQPRRSADPLVIALRLVLVMIAERRAAERAAARAKLRVVDGGRRDG